MTRRRFCIISGRTGPCSSYNDGLNDHKPIATADGQQYARRGSIYFDNSYISVAHLCCAAAARLLASAAGRDLNLACREQHAAADLIHFADPEGIGVLAGPRTRSYAENSSFSPTHA